MKILVFIFLFSIKLVFGQDDSNEILSVNVDGLLMNEAEISASSTCGMNGPEKYCRLVDEAYATMYQTQGLNVLCDICDDRNQSKRHPIEYAKSDDQNLWWQSPSMAQGSEYQRVNITIDLKQVYQIVYILLKMADSPRPGTWILERSLNGVHYSPWIFFADTPYSCFNLFQRHDPKIKMTTHAKPQSLNDDEVFCTTYYSQPNSLIAGEIIISLINGRKSLLIHDNSAPRSIPLKLINFLSARYIRFRFLKPLTLAADLMTHKGHLEKSIYNRYFYSLRNIEVGGKCICNNHADKCDKVIKDGITVAKCNCKHNTCGNNCERCCDMFNQKSWRQGIICEECNCNRKSNKCVYNQTVATLQMSVNKFGLLDGGGMCLNCRENTAGVNCEKCKIGYFRPWNVFATSSFPCRSCSCNGMGTIGTCISNGEEIGNQKAGDCICKNGYKGQMCEECGLGYERNANMECLPCPCFIDGSVSSSLYSCKPPCNCKVNVDVQSNCHTCKQSFFNLDKNNIEGCQSCYCFGITNRCKSLNAMNLKIQNLNDWKITSLSMEKIIDPKMSSPNYPAIENSLVDSILESPSVYYWVAPSVYLGNWLTSYKSLLQFIIKVEVERTTTGSQIDSPDVIIICGSTKISHSVSSDDKRLHRNIFIPLKEPFWKIFSSMESTRLLSKDEFMSCIVDVQFLLIKGKYFTNQISVELLNATLDRGDQINALNNMPQIEKCECPIGFYGLSCEACEVGYRRVNNILAHGRCEPCRCNQHSNSCDPFTSECKNCTHYTAGPNCETCSTGYFGNPRTGDIKACKKCFCPLEDYQLSNSCSTFEPSKYICHDCAENTGGTHCQRCIEGYFGNPLKKIPCKKCQCNDNEDSCDSVTGQCRCSFNTMGPLCEVCAHGFFGDALRKSCQRCDCSTFGSNSQFCNKSNGQCLCKSDFFGRTCDTCIPGYYLSNTVCKSCSCNKLGCIKTNEFCDSFTGKCICEKGVSGEMCDRCLPGYYGFPNCKECGCSNHSLSFKCDLQNGNCKCGQNVLDQKCKTCQEYYFWLNPTDCSPCKCGLGSTKTSCDMNSGKCQCAAHVVGRTCDQCELNYYALSPSGCKKCRECFNGKICNNNGDCVCPLNTHGEYCEKCAEDSWGYNKTMGCKKCDCFKQGSISSTCDISNGKCICQREFTGLNCDTCSLDFFGFPNCRPCNCNKDGILQNSINACDPVNGSCPCKLNVEGEKCNKCKNGTFSFDGNYEAGCYSCYCSGRTSKCSPLKDYKVISTGERTYQMYNDVQAFQGKDQRVIKLTLRTLLKFGWPFSFFRPVYVDITDILNTQDLSTLYRKTLLTLDIDCQNTKCGRINTQQAEVIIESYGGLIQLIYMVNYTKFSNSKFKVDLSEISNHGQWFLTKYNNQSLPSATYLGNKRWISLARDIFILALLNVSKVQVQLYTDKVNPDEIRLTLEAFISLKTVEDVGEAVTSVEQCECDSKTTGIHCEKPIQGYYKKSVSIPEVLFNISVRVGHRIVVDIEKCFCHGHSKKCNKITGDCMDCLNNTAGSKCQICAEGFYGDPINNGRCFKCECPSIINNFASKCNRFSNSFDCECKSGYSGILCERCEHGFFGDPINGVSCILCQCNPDGSLSSTCDERGKCLCATGITGVKCDQCAPDYAVEGKKCKNCLSGCTKELFMRVAILNKTVINMKWKTLPSKGDALLQQINLRIVLIKDNLTDVNLLYSLGQEIKGIIVEFRKRKENITNKLNSALIVRNAYNETFRKILEIFKDIDDTINGGKHIQISKEVIRNATNALNEINLMKLKVKNISSVDNELSPVLNHIDKINQKRKIMQSQMYFNQLVNVKELVMKTNLAEEINKDNNKYLQNLIITTSIFEFKIKDYQRKVTDKEEEYLKILKKKEILVGNITESTELTKKFEKKMNMTSIIVVEIEGLLKGLSSTISTTKEFVIPEFIIEMVTKIEEKSKDLIKNLLRSFQMLSRAEDAKQAYSNISRNIKEVEQAILSTSQELDYSKSQLKIDKLSININDTSQTHNDIEKLKVFEEKKFEDLNNEYNTLNDKNKFLEKSNMDKVSQILIKPYKTIDLHKNISSIKIQQYENQNIINNVSKAILTFDIPKVGDVDVTGFEYKINNLKEQYQGIKNETESTLVSIKELQGKLRKLRERLRRRDIYSELAHGAAAKSPEPIRLEKNCVRHYKTYFLPKSNAFNLELYLNPQFPKEQNLVLFGYDNSGGINKSFALTIEKNQQVKFWYDYGTKPYELSIDSNIFTPSNYTGLSISWNLGKWEMKHKSLYEDSKFGTYSTNKSSINNIFLGPDSHIFLGGYPSDKLLKKSNLQLGGQLLKNLKENYRTKYYKGCIYGVRLMHFDLGLQDFHNVEEECDKTNSAFFLLKQSFSCQISQSNTDNVENFRKVIKRQKREINKDYNIHFNGHGYVMIKTSNIKKNGATCERLLNKAWQINTFPQQKINQQSFQLVAVFINDKLNIGFVLGQKNGTFQFGHWNRTGDFTMKPISTKNDLIIWKIFNKNNDLIFGVNEVCHPDSLMYLGGISFSETGLREKLMKLKVPYLSYTGSMKITVVDTELFRKSRTRFVSKNLRSEKEISLFSFHSLLVPANLHVPIWLDVERYDNVLRKGFSFNVDFLGSPITEELTLISVESVASKLSLKVSANREFTVVLNNEKLGLKSWDVDDKWGTYFVVVNIQLKSERTEIYLTVNEPKLTMKEFTVKMDSKVTKIEIAQTSFSQSFYIYDIFLGESLVNFNDVRMTELPINVYLKLSQSQLRPPGSKTSLLYERAKSDYRVSSRNGEILQSDVVGHLYSSSLRATNYILPSFQSDDYPLDSGWFEGSMVSLNGGTLNKYTKKSGNKISIKLSSYSNKPEMILSINFGPSKTLNVITINKQVLLYDSLTKWNSTLLVEIIDKGWHIIELASSPGLETGLMVTIDTHSFNFPNGTFSFTQPNLMEIGGYAGAKPNIYYNGRYYEVGMFTGCLDTLKINDEKVSLKLASIGKPISLCPRVLEFLDTGMEIKSSYLETNTPSEIVKLQIENYVIKDNRNSLIIEFRFKYTGFEQGSLLVSGYDYKFCAVVINDRKLYLNCMNFNNLAYKSDSLDLKSDKWYKVEFLIFHMPNIITLFKLDLDEKVMQIQLSGSEIFPTEFIRPDIYLGSHPSLTISQKNSLTGMDRNFIGCLSGFNVRTYETYVTATIESSQYVIPGRCSIDKFTYLRKL